MKVLWSWYQSAHEVIEHNAKCSTATVLCASTTLSVDVLSKNKERNIINQTFLVSDMK